MMTREEMVKRIDELETRQFYLAMKDRWSNADFDLDRKLSREIRELKAQIGE